MLSQPTNHAYNGVSLPTLRLVLGLLALAISFYYSFKFLSVGTTGFELFSALAFVAITEATKAMYCHDIVFFRATGQGDKTVFAALIVLILFAMSITATVYFLLANPIKGDVKLSQTAHRTETLKTAITAKQVQLSACNGNYLTKCVNPRTAELTALQSDYDKALASESDLAEIQANKAFWEKIGKFIGKNADDTQMYYAILRGVVLEVIGLALIAQATANKRIQSHYNAPVINASVASNESVLRAENEALRAQLENRPNAPTH
jgi:type II secretory pathway pseudopilin PulG